MRLKADAFRYTDRALGWAKKHGMYVLFDLHGAQERQVDGKQSGQVGYNRFWDDPKAQERSLWLWKQIAARYKGEPNVFARLREPRFEHPSCAIAGFRRQRHVRIESARSRAGVWGDKERLYGSLRR